MSMKKNVFKRCLSMVMTVLMVLSCWVWVAPDEHTHAYAAEAVKDKYLFAYFTGDSSDGQTVHLAVSEDGLHYTALRNNEPVIIPSKGTGAVRDPYIWYNEQDNYYYLICTDMDSVDNQWWNNCNGFLMWRSKDLVHWYDETFINVYDMLQKFNQKVGLVHRAWAPQILWDGQSYVVYFSIDTDNVSYPANELSIVYLKTNNLMDLNQYYEYGGIYYPGSDVNDADIIQHPTNGKWYLFYKPVATDANPYTKINMMVADNATGPYTSPTTNVDGLDVFPTVTEGLEGGNGYFDNEGNFVMYADAYGRYENGQRVAYFYISKTSATGDFKNWTVYGEESHNINSLSPRHGSVVKITAEEYNRLLNNAYGITSSSFPATETLSDHLVGRYFTTNDPTYNAANGNNDLEASNVGMHHDYLPEQIGYYGNFTGNSYAKIDMSKLFPNGIDYDDGFTITFTALIYGNADSRFYSISDGTNTTNFAVNGNAGAYVQNNTYLHTTSKNLADGALHEFAVTYANGNIIVYKDGELFLKKNRFNVDGTRNEKNEYMDNSAEPIMNEAWYDALSNGTLYIGSLDDNNGRVVGGLADFCIYDRALSYYDIKNIQNEQDIEAGLTGIITAGYSGITSKVPTFQNTNADRMQSLPNASQHFSNILYTSNTVKNYDGNNMSADSAAYTKVTDVWVALYYPKTTVLLYDGVNDAIMPISFGAYCENKRDGKGFYNIYPTTGAGSTADNNDVEISQNWGGWYNNGDYYSCVVSHEDGYIGRNSTTKSWSQIKNQANYDAHWGAPLKVKNTIDFGSSYFKKLNLTWQINGNYKQNGSEQAGHSANLPANNNDIFVINYKPIATLRNTTIPNEYQSIVNNTSACPATIESYKSVVEQIEKFDPTTFNYAGGVAAAVSACAAEIQKLISDYDNAKKAIKGHNTLTIPGRDATCAAPGLTQGSYCEFCGEVFEAQTVTTKLSHTFSDKFQEDAKWYVKCNVCGLKLLVKQNEVKYENMFSLNGFFNSRSFNGGTVHNATASIDFEKSILTVVNTAETGEGYTYGSHTNKNYANYCVAVEPGTTYVAEYYSTTAESLDVFVFYYDKDQNYLNLKSKGTSAIGVHALEFTTPANCEYIEFRFDSNTAGKKVAVADFGLYTKECYDTFAKENPYSRLAFNTGESFELFTPKRIGYEFLGWYTSDGLKVENTNQLASSVTVYAKWREVGNAVLYNGNLFDLTEFAKKNDYKMQDKVLDGHVYADFANGTFNTISAREGLGKADLAVSSQLDTYNAYGNYKIPVTAGQDYVFTTTVANKTSYQVYIFFYNANGSGVTHPVSNNTHINHGHGTWYGNKLEISFTVPEGATQLSIRMGTTGQYAFTQTFSNIGLYTAEDYKIQGELTNCPTMTYVPNGTKVTLPTPLRDSYKFENWYTQPYGKGTKFTADSTAAMTESTVVYANWLVSQGILRESMLIVDFGMPIKFNPFNSNEEFVNQLTNTGKDYKITAVDTSSLKNGTVTFNGKEVTYTPTSVLSSIETFAYTVTVSGQSELVTGTVIVLPATVVYYEDDAGVVTYKNGSPDAQWESTGGSRLGSASKTIADDIYGYADAYKNSTDSFSMGAAQYVTVSAKNNPTQSGLWPVAEFTFAGTGFDVVSLISKDTGVITVKVTDVATSTVKYNWIVDTYYGYSLDSNNNWVATTEDNKLYQIPVIGRTDLPYGTYKVEITPSYSSMFDHVKDGSYDFYLDAIRVYNPMQNNNDAATVYMNDGEYIVEHKSIRDILVNAGSFGEGSTGVVYIKPTVDGTFENYSTVGPKNEVYLAKGQSVAFNMTVTGSKPTSVQVSAHALTGTASMRIGSGNSYSYETSIAHKTTLYYEVPFTDASYYWTDNQNGTYTLSAPIVITNAGDGILSLCNIKVTSDESMANEPLMFMMNNDDFDNAVYAVNRMSGLTEDDGALFVPDDMTSGTDNDVVERGEEVLVTINTSAEVYALTVNGEDATLVSVNEDGSKTWNYSFVTEKRGEQTFTLVAYDIHGFASEEQIVTVDVQSRIEIFFNKLSLFFQMIIEFFNNLAG